jgi:hypothetical protein
MLVKRRVRKEESTIMKKEKQALATTSATSATASKNNVVSLTKSPAIVTTNQLMTELRKIMDGILSGAIPVDVGRLMLKGVNEESRIIGLELQSARMSQNTRGIMARFGGPVLDVKKTGSGMKQLK